MLEAGNGIEAIEVIERHPGKIDLVISDVVMPEMDGPALLKELQQRSPELRIIFVSGYAEEAFAKSLPEGGQFEFLPETVHAQAADRESEGCDVGAGALALCVTARRRDGYYSGFWNLSTNSSTGFFGDLKSMCRASPPDCAEIALRNQFEAGGCKFVFHHALFDAMQGLADRGAVAGSRRVVRNHQHPARL